jgi:glycosyltransferase involved in cell wall biosynthesis
MPDPLIPDAILYFGNDWDAENRTSSHHVAAWLARRHRVFYLECPGLRPPQASRRDVKKLVSKLHLFAQGPRRVAENLWVRTIPHVPFHRFRLVRSTNRALTRATVAVLRRRYRSLRPIAWFVVPHLAPVVGSLGEALSVYYCTDDYSAYPGVDSATVRTMDEELTRRADLVFATSETLLARKRQINPATHLSPHGVDFHHFRRALDPSLDVPEIVGKLRGPVVGFFGLIGHWIDLDLLDWLAARRPEWTFVMIGRLAVPNDEVPRRENLLFLGRQPYDLLPAYGKRFDVAIIPYRSGAWALHANPIKLREYLAMGKPIVSLSTPAVEQFADWVHTAESPQDFLTGLDHAVTVGLSSKAQERQLELASRMTWDARLEEVMAIVQSHLRRVAGPPDSSPTERAP